MTTISLAERVDRLERQLKIWRLCGILVACLGMAAMATRVGAATDRIEARIIAAQQFDLVDNNGHLLARMTRDVANPNGGAGFLLLYPNQKPALGMQLDNKLGPAVTLFNSDGHETVSIRSDPNGPAINLADESHRPIIAMQIFKNVPKFAVFDKSLTKYIWEAP